LSCSNRSACDSVTRMNLSFDFGSLPLGRLSIGRQGRDARPASVPAPPAPRARGVRGEGACVTTNVGPGGPSRQREGTLVAKRSSIARPPQTTMAPFHNLAYKRPHGKPLRMPPDDSADSTVGLLGLRYPGSPISQNDSRVTAAAPRAYVGQMDSARWRSNSQLGFLLVFIAKSSNGNRAVDQELESRKDKFGHLNGDRTRRCLNPRRARGHHRGPCPAQQSTTNCAAPV
jgi:hypothetical protein